MTLVQTLSKKEFDILMSCKPENVDISIIQQTIRERGYVKTLEHFGEILDGKLFSQVNSKEAISWIIEFIAWNVKDELFNTEID